MDWNKEGLDRSERYGARLWRVCWTIGRILTSAFSELRGIAGFWTEECHELADILKASFQLLGRE